ncbi:MAG TPA: MFS transporter [Pirellulales bacterium]|nr:MFS transporter [Pirellulales bacterium]
MLRALAHRNFRLFFFGQGVSLIGTWMQQVAMSWLVYDLRHSAFLLGMIGFASQIPTFFVTPLAGVFTDRWNRHRTLLVTQSIALAQAALLTVLALGHWVAVWNLLALSVLLGLVNAFDIPTRQAFLTEMVGNPEDRANAIALNSSLFNGARLIGPALAGLLIADQGEWFCFLLNTISYLAVLAALTFVRVPPRDHRREHPPVLTGLKEGLLYAFRSPPIRALLALVGLVSCMSMPISVLLPVFITESFGGGAKALGQLTAAQGLGSLAGALYLASRRTVLGLGKRIALAASAVGLGMIGFSWASGFWTAAAALLVAGCGLMVQMAACNTILQTIVDEDKRGRVMSLHAMAFMGMAPLGSLIAGWLAGVIGPPATVRLGGAACIVGALLFFRQLKNLRHHIRPIYIRAGILPEIAAGMEAASELTAPRRG